MQIQYIALSLRDQEQNWASIKLKSRQLFIHTIKRRTIKFNYCKVFVPYCSYMHTLLSLCYLQRKQGGHFAKLIVKKGHGPPFPLAMSLDIDTWATQNEFPVSCPPPTSVSCQCQNFHYFHILPLFMVSRILW